MHICVMEDSIHTLKTYIVIYIYMYIWVTSYKIGHLPLNNYDPYLIVIHHEMEYTN